MEEKDLLIRISMLLTVITEELFVARVDREATGITFTEDQKERREKSIGNITFLLNRLAGR